MTYSGDRGGLFLNYSKAMFMCVQLAEVRPSPLHPEVSSSKQRATPHIENQSCIISLHPPKSEVKGHITARAASLIL